MVYYSIDLLFDNKYANQLFSNNFQHILYICLHIYGTSINYISHIQLEETNTRITIKVFYLPTINTCYKIYANCG